MKILRIVLKPIIMSMRRLFPFVVEVCMKCPSFRSLELIEYYKHNCFRISEETKESDLIKVIAYERAIIV